MWSFQITSHVNEVPVKVQSLSLLIGSGSVRQHNFSSFSFTVKKIKGEYVLNSLTHGCVLSVILACRGCKKLLNHTYEYKVLKKQSGIPTLIQVEDSLCIFRMLFTSNIGATYLVWGT